MWGNARPFPTPNIKEQYKGSMKDGYLETFISTYALSAAWVVPEWWGMVGHSYSEPQEHDSRNVQRLYKLREKEMLSVMGFGKMGWTVYE